MVLPPLRVLARMCILLMVCSIPQAVARTCSVGWFGQGCQFQCHCRMHQMPCKKSGECPDNQCQLGYFGPGCQYVDLVYRWKTGNTPKFVYDQDEDTCNPNSSATSIDITLSSEFRFFWMQIHVTNHSESFDLTVTFDNKIGSCASPRSYVVNDKMLEVTCEMTNDTFTNVTVQGNISSAVCSIYISGGRNVALKQKTISSSDKAVDGDTNTTSGKCFRTSKNSFSVSFSVRSILTRVTIHQPETQNVILQADRILCDVDSPCVKLVANGTVADIKLTWMMKMKSLTITGKSLHSLQLCEVEIFAETWCDNDRYGLLCKDVCTCRHDKMCSIVSGACGPGCHGSHNYICETSCSRNCSESNCQPGSRNCNTCSKGYTNPDCNTECPNGTFGSNCSQQCSEGCVDNCNPVDGSCTTCHTGYNGATCKECPKGNFGINCSQQCSRGCVAYCNPVDGNCTTCDTGYNDTCTTCHTGYNGTTCEECPKGTFGINCSEQCIKGCTDNCNHVDGTCTACDHGYYVCEECSTSKNDVHCSPCPQNCHNELCNATGYCLDCKFGHIGDICRDCENHKYGNNCMHNCSVACLNSICDDVTGICLDCPTGYHGTTCTPCPRTKYGDNCNSTCSINCLNQDCIHITGRCMSCVKDKMGPTCSDPSTNTEQLTYLIVAAYAMIIIPFCLSVRCLNNFMFQEKRRRVSQYQERVSSQPGESEGAEEFSETESESSSGSTTNV